MQARNIHYSPQTFQWWLKPFNTRILMVMDSQGVIMLTLIGTQDWHQIQIWRTQKLKCRLVLKETDNVPFWLRKYTLGVVLSRCQATTLLENKQFYIALVQPPVVPMWTLHLTWFWRMIREIQIILTNTHNRKRKLQGNQTLLPLRHSLKLIQSCKRRAKSTKKYVPEMINNQHITVSHKTQMPKLWMSTGTKIGLAQKRTWHNQL